MTRVFVGIVAVLLATRFGMNSAQDDPPGIDAPPTVSTTEYGQERSNRADRPLRPAPAASTSGTVGSRAPTEQIKVFRLVHGQARALVVVIEQLFENRVQLSVDERTNTIIARGDADRLAEIEALLLRLDEPPTRADDPTRSGPLGQQDGGARYLRGDVQYFADRVRLRAAEPKNRLGEAYRAADQRTRELVRRIRAAQQRDDRSSADPEQVKALRDQLRAAVRGAFRARQELHRDELARFRQRMEQIEQMIEARQRVADQIVQRRVEELLNPHLQWHAEAATNDRGQDKAHASVRRPRSAPAPDRQSPNVWEPAAGNVPILKRPEEFQQQLAELTHMVEHWQQRAQAAESATKQEASRQQLDSWTRKLDMARAAYDAQMRLLQLARDDQQNRLQAEEEELVRVRQLVDRGVVTRRELSRIEQQVRHAQLELEKIETLLKLYMQALADTVPPADQK